jgi:hypothetical protein
VKLAADLGLAFPRQAVFAAYRDELPRVLEFLPNVRAIDMSSRQEDGAIVYQVAEWHGGGEVPAAVRGILTQSMLAWTDRAKWDAVAFSCDFRAESRSFPAGVQCRGRTSFLEAVEGTLVEVRGAVEVDARKLPGIPGFLARQVGRSVEEFLVTRIQANLAESAKCFRKYAVTPAAVR